MRKIWSIVLLAVCLPVAGFAADERVGFKAMDAFELALAADPQISPDGKTIVFVRQFADLRSDKRYSTLWRVGFDGSGMRPLTSGLVHDGSPRWSPDGKRLAFVSDREGAPQIYVLWLEDGSVARLTQLDAPPQGVSWSPDGRWLAYTALVRGEGPTIAKMPRAPEGAIWAEPARVVDRLVYRFNGAGYLPQGYAQLFVVPSIGGTPRQVSQGNFHHGPFAGQGGAPVWTPDGKQLLISANRRADWDLFPLDNEIFAFPLAGGEPQALTDRRGPDDSPAVSPDGKWLAFVGFDDRFQGYQVRRLYLQERQGGAVRVISGDLDRDVEDPQFTPDGKGIVFTYDDNGRTKLAVTSLDGKRRVLAEDLGSGVSSYTGGNTFSIAAGGEIAYSHKRWDTPGEVGAATLAGRSGKALTRLNEGLFAQRRVSEPEELWVESSHDQRRIQAWLMKPVGFDPAKKYPLILEIHGGPFASYGPFFDLEKQVWAAHGYAVLYVNPRGSTSYGEEFGNLIHHAYPGDDFFDLDSAVDAALAKGFVDSDNLFVTGGSGGGVLTCWLIARSPRYRAAASAYPVINWVSWVLTSDLPAFGAKYWFPGLPWEQPENYQKRSLLSVVDKVKTPTMVITGEEDWRTPISESEQYYTALKLLGVEAVLVRVPGEAHGIRARPSHHIAKILNIMGWFDQHQKSGT